MALQTDHVLSRALSHMPMRSSNGQASVPRPNHHCDAAASPKGLAMALPGASGIATCRATEA